MKAIILAAGLGTRLRPLTNDRPKALVELNGKTLLEITIDNLISFGFSEIVINVHHFSEMIIAFVNSLKSKNAELLISDESDLLRETGGALKFAAKYLRGSDPILVHNVDIISSINLADMVKTHKARHALATLAVCERESSRYLYFDDDDKLIGWKNMKTGEEKLVRSSLQGKQMAFSGVHVISPEIFALMPEEKKFSIIDLYLTVAKNNEVISYKHPTENFVDVGKPESLKKAENLLE